MLFSQAMALFALYAPFILIRMGIFLSIIFYFGVLAVGSLAQVSAGSAFVMALSKSHFLSS